MCFRRIRIYRLFVLAVACTAAVASFAGDKESAPGPAVGPLDIDKPLLAHWSFDEAFGNRCADRSENCYHASSPRRRPEGLNRVDGLFGRAMQFSGRHLLSVPEKPDFRDAKKISFSVWTLPANLDGYQDIFRKEDGDSRVLFSFQGEGTILAFGLNVGGYLECDAAIDPAETSRRVATISARPGLLKNRVAVEGEGWAPQSWTFYMAPADDGIDLLLVVETAEKGLNAYYGVQQCFRMGGNTNETWRRAIAETPAFSEYDLWRLLEKDTSTKTSLTYVLRKGTWLPLPPTPDPIGARTPLGVRIDTERSGGNLSAMPEVGPYAARMVDPIDCGLITRRSTDGAWVCGIYWERTSHVTDHHPADCLHAIVNIGGIPPNSRRAIRGKIYWLKGSLDELRKTWTRDFPSPLDEGGG